jgi:7,8-dihydropterin-6-yl-methyl-4-(beta-D-ribofuranosyl)aminobenzene 5'-phosphate synthase
MATMPLAPVDRVEILAVLDNTIDALLPSDDRVRRLPLRQDALRRDGPVAEHGFSALVTVATADSTASLLFDAGLSKGALLRNLDVLEVRPNELAAVVLSHGHADHTRGLAGLVERLGRRRMPLLLHPDAFLQRKLVFPDGHELDLPPPDRRVLAQDGIDFVEERGPSYLLGKGVLITGQIHRTTGFETGFPLHQALVEGRWQADPYIHDDQALVVHLAGRGLVVLTGCGHAGAINTIRHAQALTGVAQIHAVIGGFHLSGPLFEPIIPPTIAALKALDPALVVPAHCTGWKAVHALARELPGAFVQPSVGTRFVLTR